MDQPQDQANHASGQAEPFTRDQVEAMSDALSMGDVWRAVKLSPDDRNEAGMRAFHLAAQRIGMVDRQGSFEDFLDRIRQEDFVAVNGKDRSGKSTA